MMRAPHQRGSALQPSSAGGASTAAAASHRGANRATAPHARLPVPGRHAGGPFSCQQQPAGAACSPAGFSHRRQQRVAATPEAAAAVVSSAAPDAAEATASAADADDDTVEELPGFAELGVDPLLVQQRPRRVVSPASAAVASSADGGTATQVAPASSRGPQEWHDVDQPLLWTGDEDAALSPGSPPSALPAPWKMLLLSDGSVTRHLQLLTGQPIKVECLSMDLLPHHHHHQQQQQQPTQQPAHQPAQEPQQLLLHLPPPQALQIPGPLVQRQVLLWPQHQEQQQQQHQSSSPQQAAQQQRHGRAPLVYAASWWASASVDRYLADKDLPIWVSLARGHLELYREIQTVSLGHSPALEAHFGCPGPFWGRTYLFWHDGAPLTLIHEVFSNSLEAYLGVAPAAGAAEQ